MDSILLTFEELNKYEQCRTSHEVIEDTPALVHSEAVKGEFTCIICLEILKKTMTSQHCLHRFCYDCIVTSLRLGNKECPACRTKLASKRDLREDLLFDSLIKVVFPQKDEKRREKGSSSEQLESPATIKPEKSPKPKAKNKCHTRADKRIQHTEIKENDVQKRTPKTKYHNDEELQKNNGKQQIDNGKSNNSDKNESTLHRRHSKRLSSRTSCSQNSVENKEEKQKQKGTGKCNTYNLESVNYKNTKNQKEDDTSLNQTENASLKKTDKEVADKRKTRSGNISKVINEKDCTKTDKQHSKQEVKKRTKQ